MTALAGRARPVGRLAEAVLYVCFNSSSISRTNCLIWSMVKKVRTRARRYSIFSLSWSLPSDMPHPPLRESAAQHSQPPVTAESHPMTSENYLKRRISYISIFGSVFHRSRFSKIRRLGEPAANSKIQALLRPTVRRPAVSPPLGRQAFRHVRTASIQGGRRS
jgi:hypothetical protein